MKGKKVTCLASPAAPETGSSSSSPSSGEPSPETDPESAPDEVGTGPAGPATDPLPEEADSSLLTSLSDFPFPQERLERQPGRLAAAQLEDENLRHVLASVRARGGQPLDMVSPLLPPYFCTKNNLLCRVVTSNGTTGTAGCPQIL